MTMQGDELKALRKSLGMTQADFAAALGVTGTFVGLMERGEKAIEPRTKLAARNLAETHEVHPFAVGSEADGFVLHWGRRRVLHSSGQLAGYASIRHDTPFETERDAMEYARLFHQAQADQFATSPGVA